MEGYYKNARRVNYGPNVKGLDFAVDGLGKFENITHAEAKNAVGSAIEIADGFDANIWKQGKKLGKKVFGKKNFGQIQVELVKFRTSILMLICLSRLIVR